MCCLVAIDTVTEGDEYVYDVGSLHDRTSNAVPSPGATLQQCSQSSSNDTEALLKHYIEQRTEPAHDTVHDTLACTLTPHTRDDHITSSWLGAVPTNLSNLSTWNYVEHHPMSMLSGGEQTGEPEN